MLSATRFLPTGHGRSSGSSKTPARTTSTVGSFGGPAWTREARTHLYLSGPRAEEVAVCFAGSPLNTPVISERIGAASAVKMGYAAYTKGTTALLTAILGLVEKEGVRADLARQWGDTFTEQTVRRVCANTAKAWRFVGEMHEIAATFKGQDCLTDSTRRPPRFEPVELRQALC